MTIQPLIPTTAVTKSEPDRTLDGSPSPVNGDANSPAPVTPPAGIIDSTDVLAADVAPVEDFPEEDVSTVPETRPPVPPKPITPGLRIGLQPGLRPGI